MSFAVEHPNHDMKEPRPGALDPEQAELALAELERILSSRHFRNAVRSRQLPAEIVPNYIPQMVDQMVTDHAMAYEAERLGFQVSDADVADTIRQLVPSLFPDGRFVGYAGNSHSSAVRLLSR